MFPGGDGIISNEEGLELDGVVFEGNEIRHNLFYLMF